METENSEIVEAEFYQPYGFIETETAGKLTPTNTPSQYLDDEGQLYVVVEPINILGKPTLKKLSTTKKVK